MLRTFSTFSFGLAAQAAILAQAVQAPFNALYTMTSIGAIPGLPTNYGAITFDRDDPNVLWCSWWNQLGVQNLYTVRVVRDTQGHVTGFGGNATPRAQADYIDGGLDFHPSGVLFYSRYGSANGVGQFKPGSTVPDRTDPVIGPSSLGGLAIVPAGLPGAGRLKTVRWPGGEWTDAQLTPDGVGTFDIVGETQTAVLTGGPDGFTYLPRTSPLFSGADVLVAEYSSSTLAAYMVDAQGDPIVATRQVFATGVSSALTLAVDPVTLDVLHAGWIGSNVHVIRGFGSACGQCSHYGTGLPGTGGQTPAITWFGCPLGGETTGVHVSNGLPGAFGGFVAGVTQQSIPLLGGTLLNEASFSLLHALDATGAQKITLAIPSGLGGFSFHFQAGYFDPVAVQGVSMSAGISMPIL